MPTQSTPAEVAAAATGSDKSARARTNALRQARSDAKALWDQLKAASEKGTDADVRDALIEQAKKRHALVGDALAVL